MKKIVVVAVSAVVAACAQAERIPGPAGGRPNFAIDCPAGNLGVCFAKARQTCPTGYTVVSMRRPYSLLVPVLFQDRVVVACN